MSGSDLLPEPEPEAEPEPQPNTSAEQEETAASPPAMAPPFVNFVAITRYTQLEPGLAEDAVQERCFEAWAHLDAAGREVYGGAFGNFRAAKVSALYAETPGLSAEAFMERCLALWTELGAEGQAEYAEPEKCSYCEEHPDLRGNECEGITQLLARSRREDKRTPMSTKETPLRAHSSVLRNERGYYY